MHGSHKGVIATALWVGIMCLAANASAQLPLQPASPFDITGFIQAATLDAPGDVLAGGTVTVNGHTIIVPRNTILQMPAAALTWQQLFALAPSPYGPSQTGLAIADLPKPANNYEIHAQGNRVGDSYIAGLIFISQHSLMVGEGFINYIDYANGEMRVGGTIGDPNSGSRVQINDPIGRFGPAKSPDVRFTIDEDNPTVRAETGYPMCLPRFDPHVQADAACPQFNRTIDPATGAYMTTFTMPAAPTAADPRDPQLMIPFEIGDYVDFNGILMQDARGSYFSANTVIANIGAYTTSGTQPVYVGIDVMLQGVGGGSVPGAAAEATTRTRVEGFTTDASMPIHILAIDVDPTTGATTDRPWIDSNQLPVVVPVDQGPPTGAVMGRWRFRPGKAGFFLPPSRELRASSEGGQLVLANGLITGQYRAPVFEFIFPENLGIGGPPVPENLETFPFLAQGSGPLNGTGPVVGQLVPWPGAVAPPGAGGVPVLPLANAGQDETVTAGDTVLLNGTLSSDPNGGALTFAWVQTAGAAVVLSSASSAEPTFVAPGGSNLAQTLTFQLTVTNAVGSASDTVNIIVNPQLNAPTLPPVADAGAAQTAGSGVLVTLNGSASSDPNTPPLTLTYAWAQTQTGGLSAAVLSNAASATPIFAAPINTTGAPVAIAFGLTVTNSAGLVSLASVTITVNPVLAPLANAGPPQSVLVNTAVVTLDGSLSSDPNGLPLTYTWSQVSGAGVALNGATTVKPTFRAPGNAGALGFLLSVSNGYLSTTSIVTITVVTPDTVQITSAVYRISQSRLKVTATSNQAAAQLTLTFLNTATGKIVSVPMVLVAGVPSADVLGVPLPPNVTVTSSLGGTKTSSITRIQ